MNKKNSVLAENRSGQQLLAYIPVSESVALSYYKPVTGAFAFIKCKGQYLIAFNKFRKQWEFPAGKIEEGEAPCDCAKRELFEETSQHVEHLEYKGLFEIYDLNKHEIRYRIAYYAEVDDLMDFQENEEMSHIMLWDLKQDIGLYDDVDKKMLQLCIEN